MNKQLHTKNLLIKAIRKIAGNAQIDVIPDNNNNLDIWVEGAVSMRHWFTVPPYEKGYHQNFVYDGLYGSKVMNNECVGSGDFTDALLKTVYEAGYMWECTNYVESVIYMERD